MISLSDKLNDFGFTSQEFIIADDRLQRLEKLVMPLIQNLIDTADQPTIKWPNRKEQLEKLVRDIKEITKS
jgi:hypothetical protein